jgi:hypothetical protein
MQTRKFVSSHRKVHEKCPLLSHLQLCKQNYSCSAIAVHPVSLLSIERASGSGPRRTHFEIGKVHCASLDGACLAH